VAFPYFCGFSRTAATSLKCFLNVEVSAIIQRMLHLIYPYLGLDNLIQQVPEILLGVWQEAGISGVSSVTVLRFTSHEHVFIIFIPWANHLYELLKRENHIFFFVVPFKHKVDLRCGGVQFQ